LAGALGSALIVAPCSFQDVHPDRYERRRVRFPSPTHHRQIHSTEWICRIRDGLPEFIPPAWLDKSQTPRRRALLHLADTA
jgi:5-methylcytosine-specific restriction protein A